MPEAIRRLSTFDPPDYVDLFVAPADDATSTSPERWARAAMEGAPALGRFLAWEVGCGFRLEHTPAPDRIAGSKVTGCGDDWIRTEARSWFMTGQMVFRIEPTRVWFATFIRYDRPIAALLWGALSAVHRRVAPGFLAGAVRRVARAGRPVAATSAA